VDWQSELGACPDCGAVDWRVVRSHDSAINFLCVACGACWFHSMGWLTRVDPHACPGCAAAITSLAASTGSGDTTRRRGNSPFRPAPERADAPLGS
jgi:hypothetical protein